MMVNDSDAKEIEASLSKGGLHVLYVVAMMTMYVVGCSVIIALTGRPPHFRVLSGGFEALFLIPSFITVVVADALVTVDAGNRTYRFVYTSSVAWGIVLGSGLGVLDGAPFLIIIWGSAMAIGFAVNFGSRYFPSSWCRKVESVIVLCFIVIFGVANMAINLDPL